jgi:hypothetical protein
MIPTTNTTITTGVPAWLILVMIRTLIDASDSFQSEHQR